MKQSSAHEAWGTRLGLILAMAGNAVGLGNFLRFPTQATNHGGGSFMITYFIALLLLGIPLMWIEWGLGRHGGRYRKGHIPGMFASVWRHPAAKYVGVLGLVIPFVVLTYYTCIESWTLAFTFFSITKDYWGLETQEAMIGYLRSFQSVGDPSMHGAFMPFVFFLATLSINIWIVSKGISGGIERLAKIGMPLLFLFALVLAIVVCTMPARPDIGATPADGFQFIYRPDLSGLKSPAVWLASAGQIFFTLSVGMGTLQTYASYLRSKDDILLSGLATSATNETAEVVLGGSIAIPAAVVFFGVTGATQIAASGAFNLGFATMPVVFQQLPFGHVLAFMWFGLLFFAGITSSVAMATPMMAFFREEFGLRREPVAWGLGAAVLLFGLFHIAWLDYGFLDEWDYWGGTFGLSLFAVAEVIIFMWIFKPENAWHTIHEGADIRLPGVFKFIMTYITPAYLFAIFLWWSISDALPILAMDKTPTGDPYAPEARPYIIIARLVILLLFAAFLILIRIAWKRNRYDDRAGFTEVEELASSSTTSTGLNL
ncbi:sodium-dependent transporter [Rhodocaloribacter litoris]|uniref:sodium-dependent transporter n=1 Tax=Rhodocaloribacter litoris TaxID=2558931 RepID=UPI0014206BB2|nr:sodium-dependent transporter [Rhodocaloribacter litoris]QXD13847.1 sodium-dependent transporter [Rhodocaloribacter litoris]